MSTPKKRAVRRPRVKNYQLSPLQQLQNLVEGLCEEPFQMDWKANPFYKDVRLHEVRSQLIEFASKPRPSRSLALGSKPHESEVSEESKHGPNRRSKKT